MERPRRSNPKKWDPSFVSTTNAQSPVVSSNTVKLASKRLSVAADDSPANDVGEKPSKRVARRHQLELDESENSLVGELSPAATKLGTPNGSVGKPSKRGVRKHQTEQNGMENLPVAEISQVTKPITPQLKVLETDGKATPADINTPVRRSQPCPNSACCRSGFKPRCCVGASDSCAGNGWTSRWYHISQGEHYCNNCFDKYYRSTKIGYQDYMEWRRLWSRSGIAEANIKLFFSENYLPYWVQCNTCKKYRQLPKDTTLSSGFVLNYVCDSRVQSGEEIGCQVAEDGLVQFVGDRSWLSMLIVPPYMVSSPTSRFLVNYSPDTVGLSATIHHREQQVAVPKDADGLESSDEDAVNGSQVAESTNLLLPKVCGVSEYMQPFSQPHTDMLRGSLPPNQMTDDERSHFPQFTKEPQVFLAMRNLIMALWALNPKEVLTVGHCTSNVLCRGLVRIRCILELPAILRYLSWKNYVNTGIISGSLHDVLPQHDFKGKVIVIGAGPAGLGAALKLLKLGIDVTILESRDRVGGRVWDENLGGVTIGHGAQLINGSFNNPFSLLCLQTDTSLAEISDRCCLIDEDGQVVDFDLDSKLDYHFETMLDRVSVWKKKASRDCSLYERLMEAHQSSQAESNTPFTAKEEQLFYFHIANLEHACGASLDKVSAHHWDQNETYVQFGGSLCLLPCGYIKLLDKLSQGVDIRLNTSVASVSYDNDDITVTTASGEKHVANCVLVTVPLAMLQRQTIQFSPQLPDWKLRAINRLGVGLLEKVSDPSTKEGVLVTFLSGHAANIIRDKSDEEIANLCVEALAKMFPKQEVVKPTKYIVTRWQEDEFARMAYSFVPVDCSGEVYDKLAAPVNSKIFFAGEATNRMHPQTVTGAYLSGLNAVDTLMQLRANISFSSS